MLLHTARKPSQLAIQLIIVSLLGACASPGPKVDKNTPDSTPVTQNRGENTFGHRAAAIAVQQIGVPYRYGGNSTRGFDCSGLVQYSYARAGKNVPRTTGGLWKLADPIRYPDLQVGDVLFFDIEGKMSHVGLYLGDGRFVHAPSSGRSVSIESLHSDFYRQAFIRGGRPYRP